MKYAAELDELLEDYTMTVGHGGNVLTFNGRGDTRKGYYMMSSKSKDITWTLSGTTASGEPYEKTGVIKDAKRSTEYTINIRYNGGQEEEVGGGYFTIDVDESEIVVDHEIIIKLAPEITGADGEDLSTPVYAGVALSGVSHTILRHLRPWGRLLWAARISQRYSGWTRHQLTLCL